MADSMTPDQYVFSLPKHNRFLHGMDEESKELAIETRIHVGCAMYREAQWQGA
ncbi:hypothetical protein CPSG_02950 [Coccidioides posadasii str. Silveira]|uniref:Uncharacterized protein n=1 Tax=Coccidioides posadasii (strain RMSCC 757 / Silveira) TaxID=443226 RepID=E9CYT0_COCPS|nr:hypothetical protein CPSG_02950 [Coccidioides posadasii str. Silveira]